MNTDLLTGPAHSVPLIVFYALIGGGMKYVDQAFDLEIFNKKLATLLALPTAGEFFSG